MLSRCGTTNGMNARVLTFVCSEAATTVSCHADALDGLRWIFGVCRVLYCRVSEFLAPGNIAVLSLEQPIHICGWCRLMTVLSSLLCLASLTFDFCQTFRSST